jgi:hypothetical protein
MKLLVWIHAMPSGKAIAAWIIMGRDWHFREAKPYLDAAVSLDRRNPRVLL